MSTSIDWTNILLGTGSVLAAGGLALLVKTIFYKYRRPNGKKGGVISLHVALAFSIVTVVAMVTKDWYLTGMTVLLSYLIARGRTDEGQHHLYQVVFGVIIGILVPYSIFYFYYKRKGSSYSTYEREEYNNKPERAVDDRHEADVEAPELRLEDKFDDIEDFD